MLLDVKGRHSLDIQGLRRKLHLSMQEAGRLVGVTRKTICSWEQAGPGRSRRKFARYLEALNALVPEKGLFFEAVNPQSSASENFEVANARAESQASAKTFAEPTTRTGQGRMRSRGLESAVSAGRLSVNSKAAYLLRLEPLLNELRKVLPPPPDGMVLRVDLVRTGEVAPSSVRRASGALRKSVINRKVIVRFSKSGLELERRSYSTWTEAFVDVLGRRYRIENGISHLSRRGWQEMGAENSLATARKPRKVRATSPNQSFARPDIRKTGKSAGDGRGKAQPLTVDRVMYVSASAARDALLPHKVGKPMSRLAIMSALRTAGHTIDQ